MSKDINGEIIEVYDVHCTLGADQQFQLEGTEFCLNWRTIACILNVNSR